MSKNRLFELAARADEQLRSFAAAEDDTTQPWQKTKLAGAAGLGAGGVLAYQNRGAIGDFGKAQYAAAKPGMSAALGTAKTVAADAAEVAKKKGKSLLGTIGSKFVKAGETALTAGSVERIVNLARRIEGLRGFEGGYADAHVTRYYDPKSNEVKKGVAIEREAGGKAMLKRNAGTLAGTAVGAAAGVKLGQKMKLGRRGRAVSVAGGVLLGGVGLGHNVIDSARSKSAAGKILKRKNSVDSASDLRVGNEPRYAYAKDR